MKEKTNQNKEEGKQSQIFKLDGAEPDQGCDLSDCDTIRDPIASKRSKK